MHSPAEKRFISLALTGQPYGNKALVFKEAGLTPVVISFTEAAVLSGLKRFRTMDEHVKVIASASGSHNVQLIKSTIDELSGKGLLLSQEEYFNIIKKNNSANEHLKDNSEIKSFAWVTADRPEILIRSFKSFMQLFYKHGRKPHLAVYDDSKKSCNAEKTEKLLKESAFISGLSPDSFTYFGLKEKTEFKKIILERLSAGPGLKETLDFALTGDDGANRNTALLHQAGKCFVSTDDDTEGRFASHPDKKPGIEFISEQDPTDFFIYPDRKELLDNIEFDDVDILGEHEKLLGRSTADIILMNTETVKIDQANQGALRKLLNTRGPVLTTLTGICGDSGMTHSKAVLMRLGLNEEDIYTDKNYMKIRLFREVLRLAPQTTLNTEQFYMSTHTGFDNHLPLPPFMPKYRSSDGLYGHQIIKLFDGGILGFLPHAVYHDPEGKRVTPETSLAEWKPGMADVTALLSSDYRPSPGTASREDRIESLGRYYLNISKLKEADLLEYLTVKYLPFAAEYINTLEDTLACYARKPDAWACDVDTMISYLENHITDADFFLPAELKSEPALSAAGLLKDFISSYGRFLIAWPDIWHAAFKINMEKG